MPLLPCCDTQVPVCAHTKTHVPVCAHKKSAHPDIRSPCTPSKQLQNTHTHTARQTINNTTCNPQEPPTTCDGAPTPPKGWPSAGALSYQGVSASYRPGLPLVLCDLSFSLPAGATCGVVGRTGSGKSSLLLTLFRMLDITEGRIMLDGVDTASIGLDALRRQLAVIPQDPVLFSGTLRYDEGPCCFSVLCVHNSRT